MPIFSPAQLAAYAAQAPAAQTAPAPQRSEPLWPYLALLGGQGADVVTTLSKLAQPGYREGNPLGLGGTMAAKAGVTALAAWLMHHEHQQGNDKAEKIIGTLGGLMGAIPAVWNATR